MFNTNKSYKQRLKRRWQVARWWQRVLFVLLTLILLGLLVIIILTLVIVIRAAVASTPAFNLDIFDDPAPGIEDGQQMARAERLAGAIRLQTVSNDVSEGGNTWKNKFVQVHQYLRESMNILLYRYIKRYY
jgi:hypothetical protein